MHKKDFCSKLDWIGVTWNSEKRAVFNTGKLGIRGIQLNSLPKNKTSRKEIGGKRLEPPTRKITYNLLTG